MKKQNEKKQNQTAQNSNTGKSYVLLNKSEDREVYFKKVENTPFCIIHDSQKGYTVVVGKQQVTKHWLKTEEDCANLIKSKDWELLCSTIITLAMQVAENKFYELQKNKQ